MIQNIVQEEIHRAVNYFLGLDGLNFSYQKSKSSYVLDFLTEPLDSLHNSFKVKDNLSLKLIHKQSILHKWNSELTVRIIHLRNTFIYLNTFYDRYQVEKQPKQQQYFQYFVEIYSYYYITIYNNLLHIINIYFDLKIKPKGISINKILDKLKDISEISAQDCSRKTAEFNDNTRYLREEMRNLFTHHDSPFNFYLETTLDNNALGIDYKKTIEEGEAYEEIIKSLTSLSEYIVALRSIFQ